MPDPQYGLGIDIGDQTIVAAVCRDTGTQPVVEPVRLAGGAWAVSASVQLDGAGQPSLAGTADPAAVGHLLSRIGGSTPVYVDGRPVGAADAVAAMVAGVLATVSERQGGPAARTVVTVPPSWGEHRRAQLTGALELLGSPGLSLVSSAVATARHHAGDDALPPQATLAVYDMGASTVDTAVVRTTRSGPAEQLGVPTAPLAWGGRDVDDAVLELACSALGIRPASKRLAPDVRARLAALRQACVAAKETLSTESEVRLDVDLPPTGRDTEVRLARTDVDALVRASVEASVDVLRRAVTDAGLTVEDLDGVLLTGGGAAMPLVGRTLAAELGRPLVVGSRPALSAALGAAQLAWDLVPAPDDRADDEGATGVPRSPHPAGQRGGARPTQRRPAPVRSPRHSGASPAPRPPVPVSRRRTQRIGVVATAFVGLSLAFGTVFAIDSSTRSALQQTVLDAGGQLPDLVRPSDVLAGEQDPGAASTGGSSGDLAAPRSATPGAGARPDGGAPATGGDEDLADATASPDTSGPAGATAGPADGTGTTDPTAPPTAGPDDPDPDPADGTATPPATGSPGAGGTTPPGQEPVPEPTTGPTSQPTPTPTPTPEPIPEPEPAPEPEPTPTRSPEPRPAPEPAPEASPSVGEASGAVLGGSDPAPAAG